MPNIQYFLGGNTPAGFYSLYHQLSDPTRTRALYIVKGGPGSGKSTLMRRVERHAQAAGLETEQVLCSGDPDSLDALILPQLGAALVDGTAPQGVVPEVHDEGQGPYFFFEKKKYQKETFICETAFRLGFSLKFPGDRHILLTC